MTERRKLTPEEGLKLHMELVKLFESPEGQEVIENQINKYIEKNYANIKDVKLGEEVKK